MKSKWQDYKNSAEKALSEGKYEFAESLWYAALEEAMDFDATDRRRALCMERLCECLWFQQKFDDAEPLAKELVQIYTKVFGEGHVDVAGMQANLGLLYVAMQKEELAEPILRNALEIKTKVLGPAHPDVSRLRVTHQDVVSKLKGKGISTAPVVGKQWSKTGRFEALKPVVQAQVAKPLTEQEALVLWNPLFNAAQTALAEGDWALAETNFNQALTVAEAFGDRDQRLCQTLEGMAGALAGQDKHQQAVTFVERVFKIKQTVFGSRHVISAQAADHLAKARYYAGDYDGAEKAAEQCCQIYEQIFGKMDLTVATCVGNLAMLYHLHKKLSEAEAAYKRCLDIRTKIQGAGHPDTVKLLQNYAGLLKQMHREDEAEHLQACATGFVTGSWKTITVSTEDSLQPIDDSCKNCGADLEGYYQCSRCGAQVRAASGA
jgi:tetratricopeptide (TPR) repeat protein